MNQQDVDDWPCDSETLLSEQDTPTSDLVVEYRQSQINCNIADVGSESNAHSWHCSKCSVPVCLQNWKCKLIFTRLKQEIVALLQLAVPVVVTLLFQYLLLFVSLIFIGHIPDETDSSLNYAAAGLGSSFVNVTGLAVGRGLATAVDTLCSQAYGYKNYKRVGVILQRGILIVGLVMFPIWSLWLNSESLLLLVQQKPCIARLSAFYTQLQTITLPFIFFYVLLQHYLNSQSIVWQFVVVGFLTNCISVVLHCILIYGAGLGYRGEVIALTISNFAPPVLVIIYVWIRKLHKQTWSGFSWQSLDEWTPFLKLAIPGMLINCMEWWSAEVITFIAGSFSKTELAATSVWFQIMNIVYMVPIGLSVATSVRVGNALGRGDPMAAKRTSLIAAGMAFCLAVSFSIVLLSTKDYIGALFISGDEEVLKRVSQLMYVAAVMILVDFVQVVIAGVLKGSGRLLVGAISVFIGYYIIGLPFGILLALKLNLGAVGLWIGMACGNFVHTSIFILVLLRSKWDKLSDKAMKLAQNKPNPQSEKPLKELNLISKTEQSLAIESNETSLQEDTPTEQNPNEDGTAGDDDDDPLLMTDTEESKTKCIETSKGSKQHVWSARLKQLILKGSLFVLGLAMLVAAGVSSQFHPYVDLDEYSNCTNIIEDELLNQTSNF